MAKKEKTCESKSFDLIYAEPRPDPLIQRKMIKFCSDAELRNKIFKWKNGSNVDFHSTRVVLTDQKQVGENKRPKHPHLHLDQLLFNILAGVLGAVVFYAFYVPFYSNWDHQDTFLHFAFVLVASVFSSIVTSIIAVILIHMIYSKKRPLLGTFKYFGVGNTTKLIATLFVELANAAIFAIGVMFILREQMFGALGGSDTMVIMRWFGSWMLIKVTLRVAGIFFAQYAQTKIALLGLFLVAFFFLFYASITALYRPI